MRHATDLALFMACDLWLLLSTTVNVNQVVEYIDQASLLCTCMDMAQVTALATSTPPHRGGDTYAAPLTCTQVAWSHLTVVSVALCGVWHSGDE